jgi:hypothetical protein
MAFAGFVSLDMSAYVNNNVVLNPSTFPTGNGILGNQNTGVPFNVATYGASGYAGVWLAPSSSSSLTIDLTSLNISDQLSFYALLNNFFGTNGVDEYDLTVTATNNDSVTYQSIGGIDTRDYNNNVVNTIANTTFAWFNNGVGQRLDLREFTLPVSFSTETLKNFTITQKTGDFAVFSGLTFSTSAPVSNPNITPEPASCLLCLGALFVIGALFVTGTSARRIPIR